ncbi:MAG: STAS/SEC14 domain-containing protein [Pseudomonadales bacterium]|nr:STAS/SEC14 domain-containing protein [Halioglobus sp.]MCP5130320.1 STAS/SEC14 domain-containing protein [Pseudomonadales bacterium]
MLDVEIDVENKVAVLRPHGQLTESDFRNASEVVDPFITENGNLRGLIISTEDFPGWDSFGALASHITFVKGHHAKLSKVAIVTNSRIGDLAETLGNHFLMARVKHFPFNEFDRAKSWILGD